MNIYTSSGGGIRVGASFGAAWEGERQGKFHWSLFDYFVGTSAGALDAALTANGWSGQKKVDLFLGTEWSRFFTPFLFPFDARKALALKWPMSLKKLADFIQGLCLDWPDGLIVNTVDTDTNTQIVYCKEGKLPPFAVANDRVNWMPIGRKENLGKLLVRSMVLPGLVADDPKYMDGGVAENPLLSVLPANAFILLIHLGYAGLVRKAGTTVPDDLIDRALYAYEYKAYSFAEHLVSHFPNVKAIWPKIYDIDSAAFNISRAARANMVNRAIDNTKGQWASL